MKIVENKIWTVRWVTLKKKSGEMFSNLIFFTVFSLQCNIYILYLLIPLKNNLVGKTSIPNEPNGNIIGILN